jgi:4-hydroxyphenylpyruvate dioxygenase
MADLFDNPKGLMGFEFVEFSSPTAGLLEPLFENHPVVVSPCWRRRGR